MAHAMLSRVLSKRGTFGSLVIGKLRSWQGGKLGSWTDGKLGSREVGSWEIGKLGSWGVPNLGRQHATQCTDVGRLKSSELRKFGRHGFRASGS